MIDLFDIKTKEVELLGFPSGQIITTCSDLVQTLYEYGFILKHPAFEWIFDDENEHKIKKIINKKDGNI